MKRVTIADTTLNDNWKYWNDDVFLDINAWDVPNIIIDMIKTLPYNVRKISIVDHFKPATKQLAVNLAKDRRLEIVWVSLKADGIKVTQQSKVIKER